MFKKFYIEDFSKKIVEFLKPYSGKQLKLMVSGGSVAELFKSTDIEVLDGSLWDVYLSDERVAEDDDDRNIVLLNKCLKHFKCRIHSFDTESRIDHIDIAIFGIGEDGHICSLFPNHVLLESTALYLHVTDSPKMPLERFTIGIKFFRKINRLIFMVPRKDNKVKEITQPHISIIEKIQIPFDIYLDYTLDPNVKS